MLVATTGSRLLDLHGIGPSGAARLLGNVGDIRRFASRAHFASWNGTAPIDLPVPASCDRSLPGEGPEAGAAGAGDGGPMARCPGAWPERSEPRGGVLAADRAGPDAARAAATPTRR